MVNEEIDDLVKEDLAVRQRKIDGLIRQGFTVREIVSEIDCSRDEVYERIAYLKRRETFLIRVALCVIIPLCGVVVCLWLLSR